MKAKVPPTSPKRKQEKERRDVDQFLSESDQFMQPMKPRSIGTILILSIIAGLVSGVLGTLLLTSLALNQPEAPVWGWLGISFPEREREIIVRENGTQVNVSDLLNTVGPAVVAFTSQPGNLLERDITGNGLLVSTDGYVASVDGVSLSSGYAVLGDDTVTALTGTSATDPASPFTTLRVDDDGLTVAQFIPPDELSIGTPLVVLRRTAQGDLEYRETRLGLQDVLPRSDGAEFYLSTEIYARRHTIDDVFDSTFLGAPVFTTQGQAVGLLVRPEQGIVLPMEFLTPVLPRLLKEGVFERVRVGMRYFDITAMPGLSKEIRGTQTSGAVLQGDGEQRITAIAPGSPAETADFASGDIITEVNGQALSRPEELTSALQRFTVGETATFSVLRNGESLEIDVTLGSQ